MQALRLPNAKQGQAYAASIFGAMAQPSGITLLGATFSDQTGLAVCLTSGQVSGTPTHNGIFSLEVRYTTGVDSKKAAHRLTLGLLIAPDPKLLWKTLPSDKAGLFWREDEKTAFLEVPGGTAIGASKRGRSHAHAGGYREDDFQMTFVNGWFTCVMCDGAGSSKYSRRAAEVLAESALACFNSHLNYFDAALLEPPHRVVDAIKPLANNIMLKVVEQSLANLDAEIQRLLPQVLTPKDFASTLLLFACRQISSGWICITYSVGDGAIGVFSNSTGVANLQEGDTGEYSGQTRFFDEHCVKDTAKRTRVEFFESLTGACIMTDGIADVYFDSTNAFADPACWERLLSDLTAASCQPITVGAELRLLHWLDFWSQGNHDDRTIILLNIGKS